MAWVVKGKKCGCTINWSAFVDVRKHVAIEKALKAATDWQPHGPYDVLVGTLTTEVKAVAQYELVPLQKTGGQ